MEFRPDGGVSLCCVRDPIGNLAHQTLAHILRSDAARALRLDLLSGMPDSRCQACGLRSVITPEALQLKVRMLQREVTLPSQFDGASCLQANQDVKVAGVDAARHFLDWGSLEGRPLRPAGIRPRH